MRDMIKSFEAWPIACCVKYHLIVGLREPGGSFRVNEHDPDCPAYESIARQTERIGVINLSTGNTEYSMGTIDIEAEIISQ